MRFSTLSLLAAGQLISSAQAHTYIWGVFVNGVDQGTFRGIRTPGYNGPPPRGYSNSPVKDLASLDMRCNVFGDRPVGHTIQVEPGDVLTLDWHHDKRSDTDDVIADSHKGPALAYLSPDPPGDNSFVKIWHKGLYELGTEPFAPGKWATIDDIRANHGKMNVRIPAGLKAGYYLLRAEQIGLHEGDVSYEKNPVRGAQFYPNCVQLEVVGNGTVSLPEGVSFPGAYSYEDPGVVHDVYCSTKTTTTAPCTTEYVIPGPTVWSGAWAETVAPELGPVVGQTTGPAVWSSWVVKGEATSADFGPTPAVANMEVLGSGPYTQKWSTAYETPGPDARWP